METTTAPNPASGTHDATDSQDSSDTPGTPGAPNGPTTQQASPIMMFRRSTSNKMLGGVCGGIADQFNVDVTLVRAAAIVGSLMGGVVVPFYIAAWLVIPAEGSEKSELEKLLR